MNELALFAGAGGGLLASRLLGWSTVGAVEVGPYPRNIIMQRQRDGMLDNFPIWDDVRTFDGRPWRGLVDVVSGGFPCQDISSAGKGGGLTGERSGLWFEYLRLIEEIRPQFVFAENSPLLRTRGLGTVIQGLTSLGYDVRWGVLGAWHIGANHKRNRMWVLAHTNSSQRKGDRRSFRVQAELHHRDHTGNASDPSSIGLHPEEDIKVLEGAGSGELLPSKPRDNGRSWWETEPQVGRMVDGVANRVDRLKAIGNGQVPGVAAAAWNILTADLQHTHPAGIRRKGEGDDRDSTTVSCRDK